MLSNGRKWDYRREGLVAMLHRMNRLPSECEEPDGEDLRERIIAATAALIVAEGRDAATTRAVAAAAGVQAPTIYRLFGDKRGLLEAVASERLTAYMAAKAEREPHPDPLQEIREGWKTHVDFSLANPALFAIMSDPQSTSRPPEYSLGIDVLERRVHRLASAGLLRVSEARAAALLQAVGVGTVLVLLKQPPESRDAGLPEIACETVVSAITSSVVEPRDTTARVAATTLKASLASIAVLSTGERALLGELLDRIADAP